MELSNQFTPGYVEWRIKFTPTGLGLFTTLRKLPKEKLLRIRQSAAPGLLYEKLVDSKKYVDFHLAVSIIDRLIKTNEEQSLDKNQTATIC